MSDRIISVGEHMYVIKGMQNVSNTEILGTEYWKEKWGVDSILKNGDTYYFCNKIIIAEYKDI